MVCKDFQPPADPLHMQIDLSVMVFFVFVFYIYAHCIVNLKYSKLCLF